MEETAALDREQYIAGIAHELRTPLTAIIGMLDLVIHGGPLDERDLNEFLTTAHDEALEIGRRIDDFLAVARLSVDAITVKARAFPVDDVVTPTVRTLRLGPGVSVESSGGDVQCLADPLYVKQIMRSLLLNAVRFASSRIAVSAAHHGDVVTIDVANDGPPVPESQVADLFVPFSSSGRAGVEGALGLGLPTSRRLANRMDGDLVHLDRRGEVVFRLTLPAAEPGAGVRRTPVLGVVRRAEPVEVDLELSPVVNVTEASPAGYRLETDLAVAGVITEFSRWRAALPPNSLLFVSGPPVTRVPTSGAEQVVLDMAPEQPDPGATSAGWRAAGGLIAMHWAAESADSVRPEFLTVDAAELSRGRLGELERRSRELDAFVVATGIESADQLVAVQEARIPLGTGSFVGETIRGIPPVAEGARRALLRSAFEWDPGDTLAGFLRERRVGPPAEVSGDAMKAQTGDLVTDTIRRAMARPPSSRFGAVHVIDSSGRTVGVASVEAMVGWMADRVDKI